MDRYICCCDIYVTVIMLKTALNTINTINQNPYIELETIRFSDRRSILHQRFTEALKK